MIAPSIMAVRRGRDKGDHESIIFFPDPLCQIKGVGVAELDKSIVASLDFLHGNWPSGTYAQLV